MVTSKAKTATTSDSEGHQGEDLRQVYASLSLPEAANRFSTVLHRALVPGAPAPDVELAAFLDAAVRPAVGDRAAGAVEHAVREALASARKLIDYHGAANVSPMRTVVMARNTDALLVRLAFTWPRDEELAAAARDVADLEQAQRDGLAELQSAIEAADVDAILPLRARVEVTLPAQLAKARVHVLELEAERAAALAAAPTARVATALRALSGTEEAVERARQALSAAETAHEGARAVLDLERATQGSLRETAQRLDAQLRQARQQAVDDAQARLRRLAGLPEAPADTVSEPDDHGRLIDPYERAHRSPSMRRAVADEQQQQRQLERATSLGGDHDMTGKLPDSDGEFFLNDGQEPADDVDDVVDPRGQGGREHPRVVRSFADAAR